MAEHIKGCKVLLTKGAEQDLESIYDYVAEFDSPQSASTLLDRISGELGGLAHLPHCGSSPPELVPLGIHDYRQVFLKPYRIIYRVLDAVLVIYVIADGRRDTQALLQRRLLGR